MTLLGLASCLGEIPRNNDGQELEANERLLGIYSPLEAYYEGELDDRPNGESSLPIRLQLFVAESPAGVNSDGETRMVPVLKAYYERLDVDDNRLNYFISSVRYYEESGRIVMQSEENFQSRTPGAGFISIKGSLSDDVLEADVYDYRGFRGTLYLEKVLR